MIKALLMLMNGNRIGLGFCKPTEQNINNKHIKNPNSLLPSHPPKKSPDIVAPPKYMKNNTRLYHTSFILKGFQMKYIYLVLNWFFGIIFIFFGLAWLRESIAAGLVLIFISIILIPPLKNIIESKIKTSISFKMKASIILMLIFLFFVASNHSNEEAKIKRERAKIESLTQEERNELIAKKDAEQKKIIAEIDKITKEKQQLIEKENLQKLEIRDNAIRQQAESKEKARLSKFKNINYGEAFLIIQEDNACFEEREAYEKFRLKNIQPLRDEFEKKSHSYNDFTTDEFRKLMKDHTDMIINIARSSEEYKTSELCESKYLESKGYLIEK